MGKKNSKEKKIENEEEKTLRPWPDCLEDLDFPEARKIMSFDIKEDQAVFMVETNNHLELWRRKDNDWKKLVLHTTPAGRKVVKKN